ncbi:MAG: hypothetical protein NVSMB25_08750 [Thermoleophilaceae bacterium]
MAVASSFIRLATSRRQRLELRVIAASCTAALALLIVAAATDAKLALYSTAGHVVLDTATAIIATLSSYLLLARALRNARAADILLMSGLAAIGATALVFGVIPASTGHRLTRFSTWSTASGWVISALAFALAAASGRRRVRRVRWALAWTLGLSLGALTTAAVVFAALGHHLPLALAESSSPNAGDHPRVVGHPALLSAWLLAALLSLAAGLGLAGRGRRERDELFAWLGLASFLSALASVGFFLYPSRFSPWLFVGDYLIVALLIALLVGVAREIAVYQRGIAGAATLEERRRLARELHDGLAQELAFISTQTRWLLSSGPDRRRLEQLARAAERALDESRSAIRALTRRLDEPFEVAVAQTAEEMAERVGLSVRLELTAGIDVETRTREALLRILREAINNTARHGRATQVTVTLVEEGRVGMTIRDNGVGFDPDAKRDGFSFGLISMRERAQAIGGELLVASRPGDGTRIEVVVP